MAFKDILKRAGRKVRDVLQLPGPRVISRTGVQQWLESGEWAHVTSSNRGPDRRLYVSAIAYREVVKGQSGQLYVRFARNGKVCRYDGISRETATAMFYSDSIGHFVRQRLYHLPYTLVTV